MLTSQTDCLIPFDDCPILILTHQKLVDPVDYLFPLWFLSYISRRDVNCLVLTIALEVLSCNAILVT